MTDKITPMQAIEMRNSLEAALVERINQTLDILDEYVSNVLPPTNHPDYIAEQHRIDLFFEADRIKFDDNGAAKDYERFPSPFVWNTKTCQPFPGRNHFVRELSDGLELWFRIEFAFRGFVGFTVYNTKTKHLIPFKAIPQEIVDGLFADFNIGPDDVSPICWWVLNRYLPDGPEATSPNFRMLDDLSLQLLDEDNFAEFIEKSKKTIDCVLALESSLA